MVLKEIGPALIEKIILDLEEPEELCGDLKRVEKQDDVLCVWPLIFLWVNRE